MERFTLKGVSGSPSVPLILKTILARKPDVSVVVLPEEDSSMEKELYLAGRIVSDITLEIVRFPEGEDLLLGSVLEDKKALSQRIKALKSVALGRGVVVFTTLPALSLKTAGKDELLKEVLELKVGGLYSMERLLEKLSALGYEREDLVIEKGCFAVRGGIVDFFPPDLEKPIRVEFFGDEVVDIREFDPTTQRSTSRLKRVRVLSFKEEGKEGGSGNFFHHLEGKEVIFFLIDPLISISRAENLERKGDKEALFFHDPWELVDTIADTGDTFSMGMELPGWKGDVLELPVEGTPPKGELPRYLQEKHAEDFRFVAVAAGEAFVKKMLLFLKRKGIPAKGIVGELQKGFSLNDEKLTVLSFKDIFGHHIRDQKPPKRYAITDYRVLKEGEPVIHYDHGVGIYRGIKTMDVEGTKTDFVAIEYAESDMLYVPIYNLDKLQRFTGDPESLKIDRLGSKRWQLLKSRTRESLKKILRELVDLYATREVAEGFSFSIPEEEYYSFVSEFPFEETPDQERAIEEVLQDMMERRPMDRIVCGDVGFGKTEVAMRAAFVATMCGKQVAVLAPTTILVEQHYINFKNRFKNYPVIIDMLSRFRTKSQQKATLERLKRGEVDIIIGTHRLLQKDVAFKDLGLLIIDEEQRFGVKAKERIREMKKEVDTLTLTATPIPRTLQHALSGFKKMSLILTPPPERKAVKTIIARFSEELIRDAIKRELERGGQVYFIHNDIESIDAMGSLIRKLVPEARVEVAHGKMAEKELERIMLDFFSGNVDVLVSTTIVENGLDVPRANTMIVNQADRFGLSQLYQLRGRIGRSGVKAYAYLLLPEKEEVTKKALERLKTLKEFEELGSGYHIAMKDLEMRGCGNLLGKAQWGKINELGIEVYLKILQEAVEEVRGGRPSEELSTTIDLGVPSYIPDTYVQNPADKFEIYRRLSSAEDEAEIDRILREIRDRFGPVPNEVLALCETMKIKVAAKRIMAERIVKRGREILIRLKESPSINTEALVSFIARNPDRWSIKDPYTICLTMDKDTTLDWVRSEIKRLGEAIYQNSEPSLALSQ